MSVRMTESSMGLTGARGLAGAFALALAVGGASAAPRKPPPKAPAAPVAAAPAPASEAAAPPADAAAPATDASTPPLGPQPLREQVAATVNDDVISTYDLRQRVRLLIISSGIQVTEQNLPEIEREALKQLVDERLEKQELETFAKRDKKSTIFPDAKEIDAEYATYAKQFKVTPAQLGDSLKNAGVDPASLREQIRISIGWRRLVGGRFRDNVHINDGEVSEALKRIAVNAAKPQYLVSEAFIDASKVGSEEQAMQGAAQLVKQIRAGAPFAAVARQFSALPSAANGGDAGWLSTGEIRPVLAPIVEGLRPGDVSDPVPVQDGVYLVQLRDKRSGASSTTLTLKQAAIRLPANAPADQVTAASAKLVALRDNAGGCDGLQAAATKVPGVVAGDLGEVNPRDLSPEFQQAVNGLKPGQIGGPVRSAAGLHLLAVCKSQTGPGALPSRSDIENRMYGEQLSMLERRYLRDLRNSAAIDTR